MAWLCVSRFHSEWIFGEKPIRGQFVWNEVQNPLSTGCVILPKGSIKKLIGRELSWSDDAVELK